MATRISIEEFETLGRAKIPLVDVLGYRVDALDDGVATLRAPYDERFLRPGGTISGPVLMALADYACFAAILTRIGNVPMAVTTNLNINFLKRPEPGDVIATARLIKLGRRLAVCDVFMYADADRETPVAHVAATYSLPPSDQTGEVQ